MNIGEQIKQIREEHAMTQDELAERLCVSRQSISNWENNKSLPDILSLLRISEIFSIRMDEMLKGTDAVEQRNADYGSWTQGYAFCQATIKDVYVSGSRYTYPQDPYINSCDFNDTRLRIVKVLYSETTRSEISLPLNIAYTDIRYAKLLVTRRLIWQDKVKMLPNFRYYFDLQIVLKEGYLIHLEFNPLYELKDAFDLLHLHVPFEDPFQIFTTFKDAASFYGGEVTGSARHRYNDGFEAYANQHYEEWKKKYSLADLVIHGQPLHGRNNMPVNATKIYQSRPLIEDEKKQLFGGTKTMRFGTKLVLFWAGIVFLLIVLNFLVRR